MTFPLMPLQVGQSVLSDAYVFASAVNGSTTSAAAPVTVPDGVFAGDLLLFISYVRGTETVSVPSGFTQVTNAPSSGWGSKIVTSARIAEAGMSGSSIVGTSGPEGTGNILLVIRGNAPISGFNRVGAAYNQSNNNPSSATASATNAVVPTVAVGIIGSYSAVPTFESGYTTPVFSQEFPSTQFVRAGVNFYGVGQTPVSQTIDMLDFGSANFLTTYFLNLS